MAVVNGESYFRFKIDKGASGAPCEVNVRNLIGGDRITLRELRINAGLTQAEAAKKLMVDQSTISSWEIGKHCPHRKIWRSIARAYKCSAKDVKECFANAPVDGRRLRWSVDQK